MRGRRAFSVLLALGFVNTHGNAPGRPLRCRESVKIRLWCKDVSQRPMSHANAATCGCRRAEVVFVIAQGLAAKGDTQAARSGVGSRCASSASSQAGVALLGDALRRSRLSCSIGEQRLLSCGRCECRWSAGDGGSTKPVSGASPFFCGNASEETRKGRRWTSVEIGTLAPASQEENELTSGAPCGATGMCLAVACASCELPLF